MGWSCRCGEAHDDTVGRCWSCDRQRPGVVRTSSSPNGDKSIPIKEQPPAPTGVEGSSGLAMLPHESIITTFGERSVVVTTCRVRSYADNVGESSLTSIFLEDVVSCSVVSMSKPWLLVVAGVLLVASLATASKGGGTWIIGIAIALAFGFAYFLTERSVIAISSAAAAIRIDTAGVTRDAIHDLISTIETAKDLRYRRASS